MGKVKSVVISNLHEVDIEVINIRLARETARILSEQLSPRQLDELIEKLEKETYEN